MSMILQRIDDARDSLAKASRYELCQLAEAHRISEISYSSELTLDEMITIFRKRGITDIRIPDRPLGVYKPVVLGLDGPELKSAPVAPVEKTEDPSPVNPDTMTMGELRKECKRLGIKMVRTDNLETLKAKLCGQNAA